MPGNYLYTAEIDCAGAYPAGVDTTDNIFNFESLELAAPMVPGRPFAISVESIASLRMPPGWQQQIFGVMSECGSGGETADLLDERLLDRGAFAYCSDLMPTKAYTHLVVLVRAVTTSSGVFARGGFQLCPDVICPNK